MMTRKQRWRRVRCRPRQPPVGKILGVLAAAALDNKNKPDLVDSDSDEVSTTTSAISTWSSFDSVESALEGQQEGNEDTDSQDEEERDGGASGERKTADARTPAARHKGVTFEPRVQVFLVTHKSELDNRAKQALWWTGRDAAINKRAWLNHLGQPGCGRQSATGHHLSSPSHIFGTSDGGGGLSRMEGSGGGGMAAAITGFVMDGTVGILGCRCQACLTEGDEHEYERPAQQQQQRWEPGYGVGMMEEDEHFSSAANGSQRVANESWPSPDDWEREEAFEEGGARSYSPASSHGGGPLHDADVGGVFSASAYFWDRE